MVTETIASIDGTRCGPVSMTAVGDWVPAPPQPANQNLCPGYYPTLPYETLGIEGIGVIGGWVNAKPYQLTYAILNSSEQCITRTADLAIIRGRLVGCPPNPLADGGVNNECPRNGSNPDPGKNGPRCDSRTTVGDPCNAGTGNEFEIETDYQGTGPFPLQFTRTYNSISYDSEIGNTLGVLGAYWRTDYLGAFIEEVDNGTISTALIHRPDGRVLYFTLDSSTWTPDSDIKDVLSQTTNGWTYTLPDGTVETYDNVSDGAGTSHGKLLSITNPDGLTETLSYDPNTGYLTSVTDPFGHSLSFTYDSQARLSTMTDPNGNKTTYTYDSNDNLSTVNYPDGTVKTYHYNESGYVPNGYSFPHALTGITDENNVRFASIYYDASGRAIETAHPQTTNSVGQQQTNLAYSVNSSTRAIIRTTVTDAVGTQKVMTFVTNLGVQDLMSETTTDTAGHSYVLTQFFDGNNNLTCKQDEAGHVTTYTYNSTNQMMSKTEGETGSCYPTVSVNTTPATRTTTYSYLSPTLNLLTEIDRPSVAAGQTFKTVIGYGDPAHPLLPTSITQSGYSPSGVSESREVQMTYTAAGELATLTDPDGHVTAYAYNNCTTGGGCGELASITNALGQVTTFPQYDAAGHLLQ